MIFLIFWWEYGLVPWRVKTCPWLVQTSFRKLGLGRLVGFAAHRVSVEYFESGKLKLAEKTRWKKWSRTITFTNIPWNTGWLMTRSLQWFIWYWISQAKAFFHCSIPTVWCESWGPNFPHIVGSQLVGGLSTGQWSKYISGNLKFSPSIGNTYVSSFMVHSSKKSPCLESLEWFWVLVNKDLMVWPRSHFPSHHAADGLEIQQTPIVMLRMALFCLVIETTL